MPIILQTMQVLMAPVVMISAGGLLCLALYNRLAMIVSRARAFHKERFDAATRLEGLAEGAEARRLRRRVEELDRQVDRILWRARLVRSALILLLAMVLAMLACSLTLGLSLLAPAAVYAAFAFFCLGVLVTMAAMVLSIRELVHALDPVRAEHLALEPVNPPA